MGMFYSAQTGGFYDGTTARPADALAISIEEHQSLLEGQASGKLIAAGKGGSPVLIDPPAPSPEIYAAAERSWRDEQLTATDNLVTRHRDELEDGGATTLTTKQYTELQAYRRALRGWPESGEFPLSEHRPPMPEWLSSLTP